MKMFVKPLAILFVTSLVASSPIIKRDAATVESDLSTLSSDLTTLDNAVKSFDGNIIDALPIANDESTVESQIKQTTTDTNSSSVFSSSDSSAVTSDVTALTPIILSTVNDLVAKKPQVASAGVTSTVLNALDNLKTLTDALSSALQAKVDSADATTIADATATYDAAFSSAIAAYSS